MSRRWNFSTIEPEHVPPPERLAEYVQSLSI